MPFGRVCVMIVLAATSAHASPKKAKPPPAPPPACDADALEHAGTDRMAMGMPAQAIPLFDAALQCKPNARRYKLAALATCRTYNHAEGAEIWRRVKRYVLKLDERDRQTIYQVCRPPSFTPSPDRSARSVEITMSRSRTPGTRLR